MRSRTSLLIVSVIAGLAISGCSTQPVESAPPGATPAMTLPVGPIPGGGMPPPVRSNPYAQNRVALAEGRKLFVQYNCAGCHGGHAGGGMGPSLRDETWIYGNGDAQIFDSIAQGRARGMPAWGVKLPEEQIWKLAAYVKSIRTPLEPDPPEQK